MNMWIYARVISVFVILAVLSGHEPVIHLALALEGFVALSVSMAVLVVVNRFSRLTSADWQRVAKARIREARWIKAEHVSTAVLGGSVVILLIVKGYYPVAAMSLLSLIMLAWFYRKMEAALRTQVG